MRNRLEDKKGVCIGGRKESNMRFAADTTLIANLKEDILELVTVQTGRGKC